MESEPQYHWSVDPAESVKIRMGTEGMGAIPPVTIPDYFNKIADTYADHPALVCEDAVSKEWKTVTYGLVEWLQIFG